jgi:hypothetical protein
MNMDWLGEWVLDDPASRVPLTLSVLGVLFVLPLVAFAAYLWRMAADVKAERRFPPSGYRVIGNRPPVTGDDAVTYARLARVTTVFFVVMAFLLVIQLWRFALLLTRID